MTNTFALSISHNPFNAPNYFDLDTFYYKQGLFQDAIDSYGKAIKYAPYKLRHYCLYAKAFYQSQIFIDGGKITPLDKKSLVF